MADSPILQKSEFWYELPEDRIAKFPLEQRDASKLLWYKNQEIRHHRFFDLPSLLPSNALLVFNNTKVIPARLLFQRETGAWIEIFLLKPVKPSTLIQAAMEETASTTWEAMIGNLKRWKNGEKLLQVVQVAGQQVKLTATLANREERLVQLEWDLPVQFASLVEAFGKIPLPPYLNREATEADKSTYQTVYSSVKGAVAAPTAGLHFTPEVLDSIKRNGIKMDYLTLHVGAGTFQPITTENPTEHSMHGEQMVFSADNLRTLVSAKGPIVAVGTTSIRSLESLYWFGVKLMKETDSIFNIPQDYPYRNHTNLPNHTEAFSYILDWMDKNNIEKLEGETSIYLYPGYSFKVVSGLITNFHQPGSTLILLISAFIGTDWKTVYREALNENYRFLSYGDSSLLWRK